MKTEAEGEGCGHKPAGAGSPQKLGEAGKTPSPRRSHWRENSAARHSHPGLQSSVRN